MARQKVEQGSGNVFADLGLPRPEEHKAKARLALRIRDAIQERGLSQADAAALMGLSQADVSKVTRGIVAGFTFDRLFRCLGALDQTVHITVGSAPAGSERLVVEPPALAA